MHRVYRGLIALFLALLAPLFVGQAYAGGGVGGGGTGFHSLNLAVDHTTPTGHNYGFLDYFARSVTVHQGDTVTWTWMGTTEPHTVTLLPAGVSANDKTYGRLFPGATNPAPDPHNPKGPPVLLFNPNVAANCGHSPYFPTTGPCTFDGHTVLNSGVELRAGGPPGAPLPSYSATIAAAPGTYTYFCLVHGPGMSGTIRVVPAGAAEDNQATVDARTAAQYQAALSHTEAYEANFKAGTTVAAGHTTWTAVAGGQYGRVAINEFLPEHLSIKPGDTVTWQPGGFHTVTFPAHSGLQALLLECPSGATERPFRGSFVGCSELEVGLNPKAFAPSGPPGQAYSGGFMNSGLLLFPRPHSFSASFPKAGSYTYECLIHPGMVDVVATG